MKIDLAIMPSLECDLKCSFCMYDASPEKTGMLRSNCLRTFMDTVEWERINSVGFYGGEPSLHLGFIENVVTDLIPESIPKWIATNGTWSTSKEKTERFLNFCQYNRINNIRVSGNPEQVKYQNRKRLESISKVTPVHLKGCDDMQTMGRYKMKRDCEGFCSTFSTMRLAIKPNGDMLFQNCKGQYPIIGNITHSFRGIVSKALQTRDMCLAKYKTQHTNCKQIEGW